MQTITLNPKSTPDTLPFGIRGENEVTEVVFDYSAWVSEYGNGNVALLVKRHEDVNPYPVVLDIDTEAHTATWTVSREDIRYKGRGEVEWVYYVDEKIAKTAVYRTYVVRDIGEDLGEAPDPYESWLDTLTELGAEVQTDAGNAKQYAEEAQNFYILSSEAVSDARNYATQANYSATRSQTASRTAQGYASEAQGYVEQLEGITVFNVRVEGEDLIFESRGVIDG